MSVSDSNFFHCVFCPEVFFFATARLALLASDAAAISGFSARHFSQRASIAFRASSLASSLPMYFRLFAPPLRPRATAAGFFVFLAIHA